MGNPKLRMTLATDEELIRWRRQLREKYLPDEPRRAIVLLLEEVIHRRKNARYRRGRNRTLTPKH